MSQKAIRPEYFDESSAISTSLVATEKTQTNAHNQLPSKSLALTKLPWTSKKLGQTVLARPVPHPCHHNHHLNPASLPSPLDPDWLPCVEMASCKFSKTLAPQKIAASAVTTTMMVLYSPTPSRLTTLKLSTSTDINAMRYRTTSPVSAITSLPPQMERFIRASNYSRKGHIGLSHFVASDLTFIKAVSGVKRSPFLIFLLRFAKFSLCVFHF